MGRGGVMVVMMMMMDECGEQKAGTDGGRG